MTKTCSGCTRGTTISAAQMWCDECENAYQAKKNCQHPNKRFYSINHGTRFREKYHVCEDCGIKIGGKDEELESVRADQDLLDNANIELNYKVIALTKKIEDLECRYSHVCKSCYGVGEIGHQLQDGGYENHTCPHCVGYVQEKVWQEAIEFLIDVSSGVERPKTVASLIAVMTDEGKRKGYIS